MSRTPHFARPTTVGRVLAQIRQSARAHDFAVVAYCFMPDHVHLIVEGLTDEADLCRFVADFKRRSGFEFRRHQRETLWQSGYHDRVLRSEEDVPGTIAYILNNPARAASLSMRRTIRGPGRTATRWPSYSRWLDVRSVSGGTEVPPHRDSTLPPEGYPVPLPIR